MTAATFLRRHWQKRPLLVRRAFPGFRDPLTRDELAGLATEPDVDSRLVLERGGRRPWEVVRGPQDPARLRRLPPGHWTLLVESVDAHVEAVADLLDAFSFLPRWRVDDVMVSFAPPGGSVGPHVDRYDVFLLQGGGRRCWQVDQRAPEACLPGLDLQVLRSFSPTAEWVLQAGAMLYLPPGLAHCGVALEPSFTYSIGFRAPSARDLLFGCLERLARGQDPSTLYADRDLAPRREPGEIGRGAMVRLGSMIEHAWTRGARQRLTVIGEILTEPKGALVGPRSRRLRPDEVRRRLRAGSLLVRARASRAAYVAKGRGALLFVDGRAYELPPSVARAAPLLTRLRRVPTRGLVSFLGNRRVVKLLTDLVNAGSFDLGPARTPARPPRARP